MKLWERASALETAGRRLMASTSAEIHDAGERSRRH
jgi:hypothetical protein